MKLIYRMLAIVALALGAGMAHSYLVPIRTTFGQQRPEQTPGEGDVQGDPGGQTGGQPGETDPGAAQGEIDIGAMGPFISVAEAHAVWDAGFVKAELLPVFLDARYPEFYAEGHVTGARRLMSGDITGGGGGDTVRWLVEEQPDMVIIYCEGGDCDASKNLAEQLELLGFGPDRLHVMEAGYPAWAAAHPDLVTAGGDPE